MIAGVVVPLPIDEVFSYQVPDEFAASLGVGCRVLVSFGRNLVTGMVVRLDEEDDRSRELKDIVDVLDTEPALSDELLRLTRWIADYYVCSWGEVLKASIPMGSEVTGEHIVYLKEVPDVSSWKSHRTAGPLLKLLQKQDGLSFRKIRQRIKGTSTGLLRNLERDGLVEIELETNDPKVQIARIKCLSLSPELESIETPESWLGTIRGARQKQVLDVLFQLRGEGEPAPAQSLVLTRSGASSSCVDGLVKKGWVRITEKEVIRLPEEMTVPKNAAVVDRPLHEAQQTSLERIIEAIDASRFETFLLHGVTGSGKTEVYIAALKRVLAEGKTGIILVPEIALTPQTVQRFRAHFGDRIAVLHSQMSAGERYDAWRHLRSGHFSVVIGPRSAIFAPLSRIGLIVVDEEHESSYKQFDPAPRYHARDVAVMRARMNGAVCVLGSATPCLESYANAITGKYGLLSMPERVPVPGRRAASLPEIHIVDLTLEKKKHRLNGSLSETLREAITKRMERREQVILLQNRRGYAPVIECLDCGWTPTCYDCSVTLTYHKAKNHLRCHYCGRTERMHARCPKCGSVELDLIGVGTQRVEEELAECFPGIRVLRMDLDTTGRKNAHHRLLDQFGRGEADILIGTQMVAKGLDFGRVTLVGVVNADAGMLLPDFRSEERTFNLLTQVAGRAGRADLPGEVYLQTRNPEHPVFRFARAHDFVGFVESVLPVRRMFTYPPFGRMAGIEFRGPDESKVEQLSRIWTELLHQYAESYIVLGPEQAFVGRIMKLYRYHTIVKAERGAGADLQQILRRVNREFGAPPKDYRIAVDIDPLGLY